MESWHGSGGRLIDAAMHSARIALHCAQSQLHAVTTTTMTTRTHGPPRALHPRGRKLGNT